jgi:nickel-dependent lactate racemase
MQVKLAYGKHGLDVDLPDNAHVIRPRYEPGLADEAAAIRNAIHTPIDSLPLHSFLQPGNTVAIVHSDITRAMPNDRVLPVILAELEAAGISRNDITLINGLGTHRPQTKEELNLMLGKEITSKYHCIQHNCWEEKELVHLGESSSGHPVKINRTYMQAEVKILTGFIEPHFFAGFSGGPKAVLPGIAGEEIILANHGALNISHPMATWGVRLGNPIYEEMLDVALRTNPTFTLNVTLNRDNEITGVFAGELEHAHKAGCNYCRESAMVPVPHLYDIVVTTNSGYPLDLNLYQSVKGKSAAAQIVRQGGSIILAAECMDGLPEHGEYKRLLRSASSVERLLEEMSSPDIFGQDRWEVQIQAHILSKADVHIYSDGLSDEHIRHAHSNPSQSIEQTMAYLLENYGPDAKICVLPEGPLTVPYVE